MICQRCNIEFNGVTIRVESKAWAPEELNTRLIGSVGGKYLDDADKFTKGGQLQKDLIDAIVAFKKGEPVTVKWAFDGRIKTENIDDAIAEIMTQFAEKPNLKAGFLGQLKMDGLDPKKTEHKTAIDNFFAKKGDFETVLTMVLKLEY